MAVGHIVHAAQAQSIIRAGRADLVAVGRELLHNPNWPIDAARKLGVPDPYAHAEPRIAYWLAKRDAAFAGFAPSTDGNLQAGAG
jgi:2,4-dienoyl-CoA reductase-like NADH-dependent reductase (Old Yellow Enzyme family)